MEYSFWGGLMLMLLMADPLGNIPIVLACTKTVPNRRRVWVIFRENLIAAVLLILAMMFGRSFLTAIGLSDAALSIGGAVIVLLMAIRMVFPTPEGVFGNTPGGEPYIVPIAVPAIAGPSTLATIMMLAASAPTGFGSGPPWSASRALFHSACSRALTGLSGISVKSSRLPLNA